MFFFVLNFKFPWCAFEKLVGEEAPKRAQNYELQNVLGWPVLGTKQKYFFPLKWASLFDIWNRLSTGKWFLVVAADAVAAADAVVVVAADAVVVGQSSKTAPDTDVSHHEKKLTLYFSAQAFTKFFS